MASKKRVIVVGGGLAGLSCTIKLADVSALYAAVGEGNISAQAVVRRVLDSHDRGHAVLAGDEREPVGEHVAEAGVVSGYHPQQHDHRRRATR